VKDLLVVQTVQSMNVDYYFVCKGAVFCLFLLLEFKD